MSFVEWGSKFVELYKEGLEKELTPGLTNSDINRMKEQLRKGACKPKKVKSHKQAREFTKEDPIGRKWKKGDEYYVLLTFNAGGRPV